MRHLPTQRKGWAPVLQQMQNLGSSCFSFHQVKGGGGRGISLPGSDSSPHSHPLPQAPDPLKRPGRKMRKCPSMLRQPYPNSPSHQVGKQGVHTGSLGHCSHLGLPWGLGGQVGLEGQRRSFLQRKEAV